MPFLSKYFVKSVWIAGEKKMENVNYVKVKNMEDRHKERKRAVEKIIFWQIKEMEKGGSEMDACFDNPNVLQAPCTMLVHGLDRQYYAV